MKRRLSTLSLLIISVLLLLPSVALAQKGEKSVGLRAGFTTRETTAAAGLYFSYRFSEHFRLSPKVDYAFRHNGTDAFSFNFDAEVPVALNQTSSVIFYPIGGLNYSTFSTHSQIVDEETTLDSSERSNHFGLNLGAGIEYRPTPTLRLAFESKCQLIKQNTGGWFTLSLGYIF